MKVENKISIAVAICFLAIGMAISALKITVSSGILSGIFAVGLSLLVTSLYKHFKYGEGGEQDERTKKIMYRACRLVDCYAGFGYSAYDGGEI